MRNEFKNQGKNLSEPQDTAIAILGWLAGEPDIFSRFLALSGIPATMLRQMANDPSLYAGLLDFIVNHEPDILAFCEASGKTPEDVMHAWHHFSGPGLDSGHYE